MFNCCVLCIQVDTEGNMVRKLQRSNDELQEQVENLQVQVEHLQSRSVTLRYKYLRNNAEDKQGKIT